MVWMVLTEHQVRMVMLVLLVSTENPVCPDNKENLDYQEWMAEPDHKVHQETLDHADHQDLQDLRE